MAPRKLWGNKSRIGFCWNAGVMFELCGDDQMAAALSANIQVPLSEEPAHNAPV